MTPASFRKKRVPLGAGLEMSSIPTQPWPWQIGHGPAWQDTKGPDRCVPVLSPASYVNLGFLKPPFISCKRRIEINITQDCREGLHERETGC